MSWSVVAEISRLNRRQRQTQRQTPEQEIVNRIRRDVLPETDLDDSQLELFAQYHPLLESIGVDFSNEEVQKALDAHSTHMESSIQAVLEDASRRVLKGETFENPFHATNYLKSALSDVPPWQPYNYSCVNLSILPQARYEG